VCECQPELMNPAVRTAGALVLVRFQMSVTADHARQIPAPVVGRWLLRSAEGARPHQLVVRREMRSLPTLALADELPTAFGQEPVITARDQLRAVGERDAIAGLLCLPMSEDTRLDVVTVPTTPLRTVDLVADSQLGDRPRCAAGEKDEGRGIQTVGA